MQVNINSDLLYNPSTAYGGPPPFTREAKRLQHLSPPCKGGESGAAAGGIAPEVALIINVWFYTHIEPLLRKSVQFSLRVQ